MARYIGPVCKLCRREGMKLYLKGDRCMSEKCSFTRRPYPPGQHGQGRIKMSEYGLRLREKQKVRRIYGVLERQFRNYYEEATGMKGITGENLLRLLEARLDNVMYRAGFALSRDQARQLVRHGHVELNGKRASIPSMRLRPGDSIQVTQKSRTVQPVLHAIAYNENRSPADWLEVDRDTLKATVRQLPERGSIDVPVQEQLIVELYSK
jgi:small subunit ribosomal protein S4